MEKDLIYKISGLNELYDAFHRAQKNSNWKASVQKFESNLFANLNELSNLIRTNKYEQKPFNTFKLNERGHVRLIKSLHISDRVVQRTVCDNILTPYLNKYLIYDNGASQKNKGIDFCRKRLSVHLQKYIRKHGTDGYILLCDFRKFFDNISHEKLLEIFVKYIKDEKAINFIKKLIDTFKIDVSYLSESERKEAVNQVFNSLEYEKIDKKALTGKAFIYKSVGIGSQISQIAGIVYASEIDNYIKIVKGIKYYARYMDDFYVIDKDKQFLKALLIQIKEISSRLGLTLSDNKTQIRKLSAGFRFLKIKYSITKTGHIVKRVCSQNITRHRRKLRKLKKKVESGRIKFPDVLNMHKSWVGNLKRFDCYRTLNNIQNYFNSLFKKEIENYERKRKTRTKNTRFNIPADVELFTDWRLENSKIPGIFSNRATSAIRY